MELFSAIIFGIKDSFNPFTLATILLFIFYLLNIGQGRKVVFPAGLCFFLSFVVINAQLNMGMLDRLIMNEKAMLALRLIYGFGAFVLFVRGVIHGMDWWEYKKKNNGNLFKIQLPYFLIKEEGAVTAVNVYTKNPHPIKVILLSSFLGTLVSLSLAIWPQDYRFLVTFSTTISNGVQETIPVFFLYGVGFVFPFVIAWLLLLTVLSSNSLRQELQRRISLLKILVSATFFSVGIGVFVLILSF